MTEKRVIKKYPNRRLYDTTESKYITLEDVRLLVLKDVPFCVLDKKTDEDITRNILLQIIIEQEEDGEPIFTTDMLTRLIGFYGDSVQKMASSFLDRSVSMFTEQQQAFQQQIEDAVKGKSPIAAMTEMTQLNWQLWQRMQEDFFRAASSAPTVFKKPAKPDSQESEPG